MIASKSPWDSRKSILDLRVVAPLGWSRDDQPIAGWLGLVAAGADSFAALEVEASRWLSASESRRFAELKFAKRRVSFLMGRISAKIAIATFLGERGWECDPHEAEVVSGVFGQPLASAPSASGTFGLPPEISVSHSGRVAAAVAVEAGHPVGVDVELVKPDHQELLIQQLAAVEIEQIHRLGLSVESASWQAWAMKEAISKALRCGMTAPWSIFELADLKAPSPGMLEATFPNFAQYRALSWRCGSYVLALAQPRRTATRFDPRGCGLESVPEGVNVDLGSSAFRP